MSSSSGALQLTWEEVEGATSYLLYWSLTAGFDKTEALSVQVEEPPYVLQGLPGGTEVHAAVAAVNAEGEGPLSEELSAIVEPGGEEKYFPSWAEAEPKSVILLDYDHAYSTEQNGLALQYMISSLLPGDRLEVGDGIWTINSYFEINLQGTQADPIWIVAQEGQTPVITRDNNAQNTVNIGAYNSPESTRFLCLRGFEITGGDLGIRFNTCEEVWLDQCNVHDTAQNAIAANTDDTSRMYFTRNEVHHTNGYGEGFYLGGNNGSVIMSNSVIALNHVHHTGGHQGDGIELKQGSFGNWIAENVVHDNNYPSILVYGTGGMPVNVVERNLCWGSGDNTMQVQGEAIVRNNIVMHGWHAFYSGNHQATTTNLVVVHNTFVNGGIAARLQDWSGKPGMIFANNACYSQFSDGIWLVSGDSGVEVSGNVVYGSVTGASGGWTGGGGLSDFTEVSWDATDYDATPHPLGALVGAADPEYAEPEDFTGVVRTEPYEAGAVELP
jgi:hypothetical protein